ncbi:MAG: conserved rane protein [Bacteroidetes bacterium]|nr:conserved rane protein [Bacteroidota bacterium]
MNKYIDLIKKASKNKVLNYIFSRYATYLIQFINSLFIAVYLGPYYLGIWGFISLVIHYINQINFGISHSVNAIIAIHKDNELYVKKIIGTSITMLLGLSFLLILLFITNDFFDLNIGSKYNFSSYAPMVAIIGILSYFNSLFSNIFRVYGKVLEMAINQSAFPILMLIAIIFFRGEDLLLALVYTNLISFLFSLILYLCRVPIKFKPVFIPRLIKTIQKKGWYLFIYNTSFYLIVISTRSFVSTYYKVDEFGYFTFAFSLANVILLLLQSFSYLIFPKILNRFSNKNTESNNQLLNRLRNTYITTSHLLLYISLITFPILLILIPKYSDSFEAFSLITLTVVLYTNSFGYSGLLIAKGKEKTLGYVSFASLLLNIILVYILTNILKVDFSMAILGTMISYFVFVFLLTKLGRKYIQLESSLNSCLKDAFPIRLALPFILATIFAIIKLNSLLMIIPLMIFIILNYKILISLKQDVKQLIINPNITDI